MLQLIHHQPRRFQNHVHIDAGAGGAAQEVVRLRLQDQRGFSGLQRRRLLFPRRNFDLVGRLAQPHEQQPVRRVVLVIDGVPRAVLFERRCKPAESIRVGHLHLHGSAGADGLHWRVHCDHRSRGKRCQHHHCSDDQGSHNCDDEFHFLVQESIQSINVLYQSRLFCGFSTQCPSSGNNRSFEGTFCSCSAVKSCRPCPTGTR